MTDASTTPAGSDRKLRRELRTVLWVLLIAAIVLAIWGIASRLVARSDLRKRTVQDASTSVVTVKAQLSGAGDELVLPGIVQAYIEASVYARTNGYLKSWYTDIGSRVRKGQLLAEIDTPEVDRQLDQAKADHNTALANLALSRTTNVRWQQLLATQSVSQQDADEKAGDAAAKDATAQSAAQNVARLNDLESFKRVVAPFDGVITSRSIDVGTLIVGDNAATTTPPSSAVVSNSSTAVSGRTPPSPPRSASARRTSSPSAARAR